MPELERKIEECEHKQSFYIPEEERNFPMCTGNGCKCDYKGGINFYCEDGKKRPLCIKYPYLF
ncbi:MAG: hypothetical protein PHF86_11105 [Candidatus Nanoarchaeia archaeon]|nr:hypothetical protein [Candidatus Nanoarchaeia archaeon]